MNELIENLSLTSKALKVVVEESINHEMWIELSRAKKFISVIRLIDSRELDNTLAKFCKKCNEHYINGLAQCDNCYVFDCSLCDIKKEINIKTCEICGFSLCIKCIKSCRCFR